MIYQATKLIHQHLSQAEGLKAFIDETENTSAVWLQFGIKNGGSYRIRFISTDNDNDVAVRIFSLLSVEDDKRPQVLQALNTLNRRFRFVKFTLDDDGDVNVEYDFPVSAGNLAAASKELVVRIVSIVDKAYPELMKAMWA